jgi:hypothetical protein
MDCLPSTTGQWYDSNNASRGHGDENTNEQLIPVKAPAVEIEGDGNCFYSSVDTFYWGFERNYKQSFEVMQARLSVTADELNVAMQLTKPDESIYQTRLNNVGTWRTLIARQLEDNFDEYCNAFDPLNDVHAMCEYYEQPNLSRAAIMVEARIGNNNKHKRGSPDWTYEQIKTYAVESTKQMKSWAFGYERDVVADLLGICVYNWKTQHGSSFYAEEDYWKSCKLSHIFGPSSKSLLETAKAYASRGYIPRFNLIQSENHFWLQEVGKDKNNDRETIWDILLYGGNGPAVESLEEDVAINATGDLSFEAIEMTPTDVAQAKEAKKLVARVEKRLQKQKGKPAAMGGKTTTADPAGGAHGTEHDRKLRIQRSKMFNKNRQLKNGPARQIENAKAAAAAAGASLVSKRADLWTAIMSRKRATTITWTANSRRFKSNLHEKSSRKRTITSRSISQRVSNTEP